MRLALVFLAGVCMMVSARASQVIVTSEPAGARVTINGESKGTTPLNTDVPTVAAAQCEIALWMDGYCPVRVAVTIVPGQFETLHFYLVPVGAAGTAVGQLGPETPQAQPEPSPPVVEADAADLPPPGDKGLREWLGRLLSALNLL